MSNWTVHLEFQEGTSSKFWRARVEDGTIRWVGIAFVVVAFLLRFARRPDRDPMV